MWFILLIFVCLAELIQHCTYLFLLFYETQSCMMMTIISHRLAGYWGALRMCHSQSSIYWAFLAANLYHHIHSNMAFPIFFWNHVFQFAFFTYAYPGPERRTSRPSSSTFCGCNHTTHPFLGNADTSVRSLANSFHKCWHKAITRPAAGILKGISPPSIACFIYEAQTPSRMRKVEVTRLSYLLQCSMYPWPNATSYIHYRPKTITNIKFATKKTQYRGI